ncbi:MAG TPA: hypothetical protein VK577_03545 [Bradyrhizobium sp.]|nr:hypothetical protein [Bradyrhizobium sp.]
MSREFSVGGDGLTIVNAVVTLVGYLPNAAPNINFENLRMWASQAAGAVSAQQRIEVVTQVTAFPTVVTATPRPLKFGDTVVSALVGVGGALTAGKCGINASAEGAGAKTVAWGDSFNHLNGYLWVATPRETMVMPAGSASSLGLFLPVAPTGGVTTNWAAGINYGEI